MKNYGLALKNLRAYFKMTQREIADRIGVSNHAISKWENGINNLDIDSVRRLCEIFGITTEQFFLVASGESVERALRRMPIMEESAVAVSERVLESSEEMQTEGAGMRPSEPVQLKWWAIVLIFFVVAALTAGIILLPILEKGDTAVSSSQSQSSESELPVERGCEIRYYVDGELFETQKVKKGESATPIKLEKYGYVFHGWYQNGGKEKFDFSSVTADVNDVHAVFTLTVYTVVFTDGAGDYLLWDLQYGQAWNFPSEIFTKSGYKLTGWTDGENTYGLGAQGAYLGKKQGDRVELNAVWELLPLPDYSVEFLTEDGIDDALEWHYYGESWTVSRYSLPKKGYLFDCWECDGKEYRTGDTVSITEGTQYTFVARYKPIRFYVNFCETRYGSQQEAVYFYDGLNYLRSDVFMGWRENEYIEGWRIDDVYYGADEYIGNFASEDGATFWAIAVWKTGTPSNYTLYFEDSTVLGAKPIQTQVGQSVVLPDCKYEREGYSFVGWEYQGTMEVYKAGESFTLTVAPWDTVVRSCTFVAVWRPISFTVVYQSDMHEDTLTSVFRYGEVNRLSDNGHTAWNTSTHRLVGWEINGKRYALGEDIGNLSSVEGEVLYAKAIWEKIE